MGSLERRRDREIRTVRKVTEHELAAIYAETETALQEIRNFERRALASIRGRQLVGRTLDAIVPRSPGRVANAALRATEGVVRFVDRI